MINKTLAHYEVLEKIGEGGMGEVYRARDSKLGRDVALKFLPESFARDAERLGRFEREAKLLATLNHGNIASIYGIEQSSSQRFLVLELVEGLDLAQRLAQGPIPEDEALQIALQVAEALEAAHEQGVVHRDLKPANIKVTPDGKVKVLDFGLAKALDMDSSSSHLSHSPTLLASSPTMQGVILGTAAYMSPEQARGKTVDKRADIYAFGSVIYEMLAAKQCFSGSTVSDTLAAVLRAEPDWDALPKNTARPIVRLLRRCLDKDVRQRLRDIGEARIVIDGVLRGSLKEEAPAAATTVPAASRKRTSVLAWSLVGVMTVVSLLAIGGFIGGGDDTDVRILRTSIVPPENVRFNLRGGHPGPVALSPDGKRVVYTGRGPGGSLLYVRELDAADARPLPGTADAGYPFWSPDGRSIGFFAGGKLKRVDIDGSPPLTLCDAPVGKGGAWNEDGTIIFAPSFNTPIHRVADVGGTTTAVTAFHGEADENSHRFPQFFPDGDHFIYFARVGGESSVAWVGSLSGGSDKEIMRVNSNAVYASGHLLFMRETTLMARPFDPDTQEFTGDPMALADPVRVIPGAMRGIFDASENGMVVYQSGASVPGSQLVWRDLEGKELNRLGDVAQYEQPAISPDGKYVAVDYFDNSSGSAGDIWIYDIERAVRSRFTFDPSSDGGPIWSPAGDRIVFSSSRGGRGQLYVKNFGGASNEELLVETEGEASPTQWVGDYLVYSHTDSSNTGDIWAIAVDGDRRPIAVLNSTYGEYAGRVSPNGNWIAYASDESGKFEAYVTSFPTSGRKWQVSTGGGGDARWDPTGRGIYYFGADNTFRFVEVEFDAKTFAVGRERTLFESNSEIAYDLTSDGKRLLLLEDSDEGSVSPLTLVTNWPHDLEQRRKR